MTLGALLAGVRLRRPLTRALESLEIKGLEYDSRRVEEGFLFFAFAGARSDGRDFAVAAMDRGAIAIVSELPAPAGFAGPWIEVEHGRRALSAASRVFYHHPDRRVHFTGITGIPCQDMAMWESMGPIVDRSKDHPGASDITLFRCRIFHTGGYAVHIDARTGNVYRVEIIEHRPLSKEKRWKVTRLIERPAIAG